MIPPSEKYRKCKKCYNFFLGMLGEWKHITNILYSGAFSNLTAKVEICFETNLLPPDKI